MSIFNSNKQILRYSTSTTFKVFYLEAPLSLVSKYIAPNLIDNLVELNIYHSAVGFQSTDPNNQIEFVLGHEIKEGFTMTSLLPKIVTNNSSNEEELEWNNDVAIIRNNYIDRDYWTNSTYITTVNGNELVKIQQWVLNNWLVNNPIYVLFSGSRTKKIKDIFNPFIRSADCFDFAYHMILYIKNKLNARIEYTTIPQQTVSTFVDKNSKFIPVDYKQHKKDIIQFYKKALDYFNKIMDIPTKIDDCIKNKAKCPEDIAMVQKELFTITHIYQDVYKNNEVGFLYGYHPDGSIGYWKIVNPMVVIDYVNINIPREPAITVNGDVVNEPPQDDKILQGTALASDITGLLQDINYLNLGIGASILLLFIIIIIAIIYIY